MNLSLLQILLGEFYDKLQRLKDIVVREAQFPVKELDAYCRKRRGHGRAQWGICEIRKVIAPHRTFDRGCL